MSENSPKVACIDTGRTRLDVAVWLNTTPDHLDRHGDMTAYVAAKKRIFLNQGAADWAVIGVDDAYCAAICTELTRNAVQTATFTRRRSAECSRAADRGARQAEPPTCAKSSSATREPRRAVLWAKKAKA